MKGRHLIMNNIKEVINWIKEEKESGKQEVLQEVFEWLNKNFFTGDIEGYYSDVPEHIVQGKFDCKEEMIQAFKERFNIE